MPPEESFISQRLFTITHSVNHDIDQPIDIMVFDE